MGNATDAGIEDALVGTTDILVKALRALGQAGQPDTANRLAAKAWWALKEARPREAERINGAMHFLARLESDAHPTDTTAPKETA